MDGIHGNDTEKNTSLEGHRRRKTLFDAYYKAWRKNVVCSFFWPHSLAENRTICARRLTNNRDLYHGIPGRLLFFTYWSSMKKQGEWFVGIYTFWTLVDHALFFWTPAQSLLINYYFFRFYGETGKALEGEYRLGHRTSIDNKRTKEKWEFSKYGKSSKFFLLFHHKCSIDHLIPHEAVF